MILSPERLAGSVRARLAATSRPVSAFWVCVPSDREEYLKELRTQLAGAPVVAAILRNVRFTNPNALLSDFIELVTDLEHDCRKIFHSNECERCAVVIIAKNELSIPQVSSPVVLPQWFPRFGGTTVSMIIEDLTWQAEAPVDALEARISALSELLYDLEHTLTHRVAVVHEQNHNLTSALLDVVRQGEAESMDELIRAARAQHTSVTNAGAYRPSRRGGAFTARIWNLSQTRTPDQLTKPSRSLARALDLPEELGDWHESILNVLRRPPGGEDDGTSRFARNLIVTVGGACQLVTAAAHSDAYPQYPVPLLRSLSLDLRQALVDAERTLSLLS